MKYAIDWRKSIRMQYKIRITELAEKDLEDIGDYIVYELLNYDASINTVKGIRKKINDLKYFPERNELDEDSFLAELGVRMDYYRNYKIFYVIDKNEQIVYIVRILHMLVDSRTWLYRAFKTE